MAVSEALPELAAEDVPSPREHLKLATALVVAFVAWGSVVKHGGF